MANALFDSYVELCLTTGLNVSSSDIRTILHDAADTTVDTTTHDFLDDIAAGGRVATSGAMGSKTTTNGAFDAADVTWSAVSGDVSEENLGYYHSGTESTASLIWYMDTFAAGMPVTPNGGDITIAWNASGIYQL